MMKIQVTDDFDPDRIAESGQCFRWERDDSGAYRIIHKTYVLRLRVAGDGIFELSCPEDEYRKIWYDYFDFCENYRFIRERIRSEDDPFLAGACAYGKGIRILRQDPWETLISFIISQNKNIPAIRKSIQLLCEAAGERREDGKGPYYLFPDPERILALSDDALTACRLGYRCRYVRAAAADVAEGRLDLERLRHQSEESALSALTGVCGVGIKVASCVSLFGLHHVDSFPVDVWIRRILEKEYPDGYPKDRYSPYNGIYQQYMFYFYREKHGKK